MRTYFTDLRQDTGHAVRLLRRAPGFSAIAVATLALGIGASTAMFTIVDAVLLQPLPFGEPDRLMMVRPSSGSRVSAGYLHDWRLEATAFRDMAGWHDVRANLTGAGAPLEVLADRVTPNLFATLGVTPMLGRTFTHERTLSRVEPEVVLSFGLWQRRFGGDPAVVGQAITLDGDRLTVIGIMPDGLTIRTTELAESRAELWMPLRLSPGPDDRDGMGGNLHVVGRLAPDATRERARTELARIAQRIEAEHPPYSRDWIPGVIPLLYGVTAADPLTLASVAAVVGVIALAAIYIPARRATLVDPAAALAE